MSTYASVGYKGKNFDPNYSQKKRQQGRTDVNGFRQTPPETWNPNPALPREPNKEYDRRGDDRHHDAGSNNQATPNGYLTPRRPRGSHSASSNQAPGPSVPSDKMANPSRLGLVNNIPTPFARRGMTGNTPSLTSEPTMSSDQPNLESPAESLPSGTSLGSLDKLRQFKAEVEATRRQRNAPELEPGKLAQMAQSFLLAQQHEPGEVVEELNAKLKLSPRSREQQLKDKLRSRLQSNEAESTGNKRERPEIGEIVEIAENKRLRTDEPLHSRATAQPSNREQLTDERGGTASVFYPDGSEALVRNRQDTAGKPHCQADLPFQPRESQEGVPPRPMGSARGNGRPPRQENALSNGHPPERKEAYRPTEKNFVPPRFQTAAQPQGQPEHGRKPFPPRKRSPSLGRMPVAAQGNGIRYSSRAETSSISSRKESSGYERRSLSERISDVPLPVYSTPTPAAPSGYRGPTREISPPPPPAQAGNQRPLSLMGHSEPMRSTVFYDSRALERLSTREYVPPYDPYTERPARAPAAAIAESRANTADAYAHHRGSALDHRASQYQARDGKDPTHPRARSDQYERPSAPLPPPERRSPSDDPYVRQAAFIDPNEVVETLAALKAQISRLEALVPTNIGPPSASLVREFRDPFPAAPQSARRPPPESYRDDCSHPPERSYEPTPRRERSPPASAPRSSRALYNGRGSGRGHYQNAGYSGHTSPYESKPPGNESRIDYDNRSGYDRGGGRGGRGGGGGPRGRGRGGRGYGYD